MEMVLFYEKCRLCLDRPGSANICDVQDLPQDIFTCTSVKVSPKDNLPQKICIKCYEVVKKAKDLKSIATANDAALRSILVDDNQDNQRNTIPNTSEDDTSYVNPTDFLESVCLEEGEKNSNNKNLRNQSQEEMEAPKIDENFNDTPMSSNSNEKKSRKRKTTTKEKSNEKKGLTKPTRPAESFGLTIRKDLFEPYSSQVSSSTKVNKDTNVQGIAVPKTKSKNQPGVFQCKVCNKTVETYKKLYMHMRQHNKPFHCPLDACEKKFSSKSDLEKHKRTHTGEKPYFCDICDKSFAQQGTLRAHRETVHCIFIYQ